jgi:predicted DsbA family dithiol-disulfide isomerase
MKQFEGRVRFEVHWHPYQLNSAAPEQGVDKMAFYRSKVSRQGREGNVEAFLCCASRIHGQQLLIPM